MLLFKEIFKSGKWGVTISTGEVEKEETTDLFSDSSQEINKQNQIQEFLKIPVRISD